MNKLKIFFSKNESLLSSSTLILGFLFDYLTLHRVDFLLDNLFVIFYLILAGTSIIWMDLYEDNKIKSGAIHHIYEFLPFIIQFCFGGLFSAFAIFYSQSASLFTSGVFVLIFFILLIGNEFFKKKYSKLVFQVGIYFVALFSFFIYFLPVLVKQMGILIFLASGGISLVFISIFIFIIFYLDPGQYKKENNKFIFLIVSGLYVLINLLYFTNIIPPIPLSLKIGDVYYFVQKQFDGNYLTISEKNTWREKFGLSQKIHLAPGEPAYVFSSVFAPTDLGIKIVHDWQNFNEVENKWISLDRIIFSIEGGRGEGYRGFSKKENVFPGKWRVDIKTERGQVIGRVRFDIEVGSRPGDLQNKTL